MRECFNDNAILVFSLAASIKEVYLIQQSIGSLSNTEQRRNLVGVIQIGDKKGLSSSI